MVVFMHNIPSGREANVKPTGPNNTDPGCWHSFSQQCLLTIDMTFDEARFDWHDVNQNAASQIAEVLTKVVKQQSGACDRQSGTSG